MKLHRIKILLVISCCMMVLSGCKALEVVTPTKTNLETPQTDSKEAKLSDEEIQAIISDLNFPKLTTELSQLKSEASILKLLEEKMKTSKQSIKYSYYALPNKKMIIFPKTELPSDYDPTTRPWYKDTLESTESVHMTDIYDDAITNEQFLSFSARVMKDNKLLGVVGFDLVIGEAEPPIDDPNTPKLTQEDIQNLIDAIELIPFSNELSKIKDEASIVKKLEEKQTTSKHALLYCYYGLADKKMLMFPIDELPSDYDPTLRPWYIDALKSSQAVHVTDLYLDPSLNKYILTLSIPVKNDEKILGVLGVDVIIEENKN